MPKCWASLWRNLLQRGVSRKDQCAIRKWVVRFFCGFEYSLYLCLKFFRPMKKLIFTIVGLLLLWACSTTKPKDEVAKPNIVLFLVDDMGWQDTSLPFDKQKSRFNGLYETPAMEALAGQGMQFTNAYATAICSPSRVSLMTGSNAARHRVTNWTLNRDTPTDWADPVLDLPEWNVNGISVGTASESLTYKATPLPELLREQGYYTVHVGKAHFGAFGISSADPLAMGFDVNVAGHAAGGLASYLGTNNFARGNSPFNVPGLEKYHGQDIFITEALTREALAKLDARPKGKPFFLYMSHYAVHIPMEADKRFYQKYLDKGMPEVEAKYASMLEGMDKSLGDIMDYLKAHKLLDNTLVLFMSDNGGLSAVGRAGVPNTHNAPLKSGKGSAYEGGTRVPMIAFWKGKVLAGSKCEVPLIIEDYFPTLLEVAGLRHPKTVQPIDGKSFLPLLLGKKDKVERPLFWHFPNKWDAEGLGIAPHSAVRKGDWKLIYFHETGAKELYNLKDDLSEEHNVAAQHPEKVRALSKLLRNHLKATGAQMPTVKATGKAVALP